MTIVEHVAHERRRVRALFLASGVLLVLATLALGVAAGVAALGDDRWLALPSLVPWLAWALALGAGGVVLWLARRALRRDAGERTVATAIERDQSLRAGALRVALEVRDTGALGRRAAAEADARLTSARGPLAPSLRGRAMRRLRLAGGAAALAAIALVAAGAAAGDGWAPMAHPLDAARGRLLPPLRVDAPAFVVRGEPLTVRVAAERRRSVSVRTRARGAAWQEGEVTIGERGTGELRVPRADADFVIVASDGRSTSDTATVRVVERPFVGDVALEAVYPAYLGRAREPLAAGALARVPQGTVILVSGRASTELREVRLERPGESIALAADGHRFTGRLAPRTSGRWTWRADGRAGTIAEVPPPLELELVPDSAPRVELLTPSRDSTVSASGQVRVGVGVSDDHGVARVELRTTRRTASGNALPSVVQTLAGRAPSPWMGESLLDLASLGLEPGDELRVIAQATDASPWAQRGESRELVLRVPSLTEQRSGARSAADSAVAAAAALAAAQRELQRRTGDAAKARSDRARGAQDRNAPAPSARNDNRPPAMSFETAEKARSIAKEQRALAERVQQLQEQAKRLEKQLREAGALDSALQSRMQEVQRLLKDAITPEMAARLAELENATQRLQNDQARQAMGDLSQQQQRLREQLERSVEMLKRAALEGSMETLRDEAKELAAQQRALADSLAGREPRRNDAPPRDGDSTAQRGERPTDARRPTPSPSQLAERSRDLSKEIDRLAERLKEEGAQAGAKHAETASQQADASAEQLRNMQRGQQQGRPQGGQPQGSQTQGSQTQGGQQQAGQQGGQQGEAQSAPQAAEAAAQRMQRAAEEMAAAREQQVDEWKQALARQLDEAILETLQLARQEQQLAEAAQAGQGGESRENTRAQQSALQQGGEKLGDRVGRAAQQSSHVSQRSQRAMSDAVRKMAEATREAGEQRAGASGGQGTASAMRDAASALNQAAASLVRDRERLGAAGSASGFAEMMQRMQELAQQQGALAAQASGLSLMPGGQKGQGTQTSPQGTQQGGQQGDRAGATKALARGQRQVAEGLEEVSDADGSGKTDEMAAEARRLAQALERGVVDPAIIERQQRLFRRLLDAGRSMERDEREDTGKRESRSADGSETFAPGTTDANGRAAQRFRPPDWNELRGLTAEERRVVLEYFKRINAAQP